MVLILYLCMSEWRIEEVEHINATLSGAERKAALCALLEQETQFISSIERHRMAAGTRNQDKAIQAFLNKVSIFANRLSCHVHTLLLTAKPLLVHSALKDEFWE